MKVLEGWADSVPAEARRFHAIRTSLLEQARESSTKLWPWSGAEDIRSISSRVRELEPVADGLRDVFARRAVVEQLAEDVASHARELPDADTRAKAEEWRSDWRAALREIGTGVDTASELSGELETLARTANDLREVHDGVRLLREAADWRGRLKPPYDAVLTGYDGWLRRFRSEGASASLLTEVEQILAPLRAKARSEPPAAPPDTLRARALQESARRWARALGAPGSDVEKCGLELEALVSSGATAHKVEALVARLEAFIEQLQQSFQSERASAEGTFSRWQHHFAAACPTLSDDAAALRRAVEHLAALRVDSSDGVADWRREVDDVAALFDNLATPRRTDLAALLGAKLAAAERAVDATQRLKPGSDQSARLRHLAAWIQAGRQIDAAAAPKLLFDTLTKADEVSAEIQRARDEIQARQQEQRAELERVTARYAHVTAAASGAGLRVDDLGPALAAAGKHPDTFVARLEKLTAALEKIERGVVDECLRQLRDMAGEESALNEVLSSEGELPDPLMDGVDLTPDADMDSSIGVLIRARARQERLQARLTRLDDRIVSELRAAHEAITLLSPGLSSDDRPDAVRLGTTITELLRKLDSVTVTRQAVAARSELLRDYRRFDARVRRQETNAREKHARLSALLRGLRHDGLMDYHPAATKRCSGLLEALPWNGGDWLAVTQQLAEAEVLLKRLQEQGRRRAASEFERACATLRDVRHALTDEGTKGRVQRALGKLAGIDEEKALPAHELREEIVRLATEVTGG